MELTADYVAWHGLLAREIFNNVMESPVAVFVDDDELARLADGEADLLVADLATSVRGVLDLDRPKHMFDRVLRAQESWQHGQPVDPPPTLPLLALSVLAATHMRRDGPVAPNNYYKPLAQLLLPSGSDSQVLAMRDRLREGTYLPVTRMWEVLDAWISRLDGLAGISTIRSGHLPRIGYALSQALLRRNDRAILTQFFEDLQVSELGPPPVDSLMEMLAMWSARPRGLSGAFIAALHDPDLSRLIAPSVAAWAAKWDGQVITSEGLRRTPLRVLISLDDWTAVWAIPAIEGIDSDSLAGRVDGTTFAVSVAKDDYSALYRLDDAPAVDARLLAKSFRVLGTRCAADFTSIGVLPFVEMTNGEGWLSADSIAPYREHLLAARVDVASEVEKIVRRAADPGWKVLPMGGNPLLPGFRLLRGVSFSDLPLLDAALMDAPGLLRLAMRPAASARPRLSEGLRLMRAVHPRCYLLGGEPDLVVPYGDAPRYFEASLDGRVQVPQFRAAGFPIPLRPSGPLDPGQHVVRVDDESIDFWIAESDANRGEVSGAGEIGWSESCELVDFAMADLTCGAVLTGELGPAPWMALRGQSETWLLRPDGICQGVDVAALPVGLLARIPTLIPYYFEIPSEGESTWLVQLGARWKVTCLNPLEPSFGALDDAAQVLWRRLEAAALSESPLWTRYIAEWRRCVDR